MYSRLRCISKRMGHIGLPIIDMTHVMVQNKNLYRTNVQNTFSQEVIHFSTRSIYYDSYFIERDIRIVAVVGDVEKWISLGHPCFELFYVCATSASKVMPDHVENLSTSKTYEKSCG
ncbi:MAG: hypothetical protein NVS4B11_09060 [Ktedonobacteraceae bacterium]